MPLHRRLPKRGFTNIFKKQFALVNLGRLDKMAGDTFSADSLMASGIIKKLGDGLKVLGSGELTRPITVQAHLFSEFGRQKIRSGGRQSGSDRRSAMSRQASKSARRE